MRVKSQETYLGIDVGGTKMAVGVVSCDGSVLARTTTPTPKACSDEFVATIVQTVRDLASGFGDLRACGIALPASIDRDRGLVEWCPNIPALDGLALGDRLCQELGMPVVLEYDGHALAMGEHWKGSGIGSRAMLLAALGTGIGGGVILDGKIHRGANGIAGALGWMIVNPEWTKKPSLTHGNLETEASGVAYNRKLAEGHDPDEVAREIGVYLGIALSSLVSVLGLDLVVVGGGFGCFLGQPLVKTLEDIIARCAAPHASRHVQVRLSSLGVDAGIIGSAHAAAIEYHCGDDDRERRLPDTQAVG